MLFRRKKPADWREKLRIAVWPRRSWMRSTKYIAKRVLRLTASPHAIAAGVAAGVFASFLPYLGFHFLIAFCLAYLIGGNFIAAAAGTFFGNPFSFPFIWASTYATGRFILSGGAHVDGADQADRLNELADTDMFSHGISGVIEKIASIWEPVILPMSVGAVPLGVLVAILAYVATRWLAIIFRAQRRQVLAEKAAAFRKALADRRKPETRMPEGQRSEGLASANTPPPVAADGEPAKPADPRKIMADASGQV